MCAALPRGRPVPCEPVAHLLAEGVGGWTHVVGGKRGHVLLVLGLRAEQVVGEFGARARHAAEAGEVGVHAPEVARRLVLLGIADGAERPMRLDRRPRAAPGPAKASAAAANTLQSGSPRSRASAAVSSASRAPSRLIR